MPLQSHATDPYTKNGAVDPYAVLGVRAGETNEATLTAAYKKRSRECHPDAGGSEEAFSLVGAAHQELLRRAHEERWGTSSGAIGSGIKAPLLQITWEPRR